MPRLGILTFVLSNPLGSMPKASFINNKRKTIIEKVQVRRAKAIIVWNLLPRKDDHS